MVSLIRLISGYIQQDEVFGPLPNEYGHFDAYFIDKSKELIEAKSLETSEISEFELRSTQKWMTQVPLAKNIHETNLEIIYDYKRIYFRAVKHIQANEALFVYPSKVVEISLGLQFIRYEDGNTYICKKCNQNLEHQFCLVLHLKYFCKEIYKTKRKLYSECAYSKISRLTSLKPEISNLVYSQSSQNWCAMCNIHFRLTNDLVNHMRLNHGKSNYKSEREVRKKLKCDVCGDTFKERHHLTRHLNSHR